MANTKFRNDIKRHIAKAKSAIDGYAKAVVLGIDRSLVLKSPVDKGRFRANWQIGNNAPNTLTTESTDLTGAGQIAKAAIELQSINVNGQIIYITNALSYAYRLEYEGWSQQAPQGMVRVTLAEIGSILQGAAYEVKS